MVRSKISFADLTRFLSPCNELLYNSRFERSVCKIWNRGDRGSRKNLETFLRRRFSKNSYKILIVSQVECFFPNTLVSALCLSISILQTKCFQQSISNDSVCNCGVPNDKSVFIMFDRPVVLNYASSRHSLEQR